MKTAGIHNAAAGPICYITDPLTICSPESNLPRRHDRLKFAATALAVSLLAGCGGSEPQGPAMEVARAVAQEVQLQRAVRVMIDDFAQLNPRHVRDILGQRRLPLGHEFRSNDRQQEQNHEPNAEGHDLDAKYCKYCSQELIN